MHRVKNVKSTELFPAISDLLKNNQKVRITVTGNSMMPFLREGIDSIELSKASLDELHFGQIPLIKRSNGQYILHRLIYKSKSSFYIAGDAQLWVEGPLLPEQLIAVVTQIWRKDKPVSPENILLRAISLIWWLRLPAIYAIKIPYRFIKRKIRT